MVQEIEATPAANKDLEVIESLLLDWRAIHRDILLSYLRIATIKNRVEETIKELEIEAYQIRQGQLLLIDR
jgi:hypothetical protein